MAMFLAICSLLHNDSKVNRKIQSKKWESVLFIYSPSDAEQSVQNRFDYILIPFSPVTLAQNKQAVFIFVGDNSLSRVWVAE